MYTHTHTHTHTHTLSPLLKKKCKKYFTFIISYPASPVAQLVKNLPAIQETGVRSLGWEDPMEKEMATHSSILAWKIPWTEKPGPLQSVHGVSRVGHNLATKTPHIISPEKKPDF